MTALLQSDGSWGLDEKDTALLAEYVEAFGTRHGPRVGDWVDFADGVRRRISHVWDFKGECPGYQTSDGGSWAFFRGGCSFSGSLFSTVPGHSLNLTDEVRPGEVWIAHHGRLVAECGRYAEIGFRVFRCSLPAPR
jgi:hypothetical protein